MIEWIVSSSALVAVVILLRALLKGKISLRLQYALWGLALLRLLVPVSFGNTSISVQNALPVEAKTVPQTVVIRSEAVLLTEQGNYSYSLPAQWEQYETRRQELKQAGESVHGGIHSEVIDGLPQILTGIWLLGMAAAALCLFGSNLRFALRLGKTRKLLRRDALPVYLTEETDTPCLFGLFRPAVYVTPEAAEEEGRLRHVIEHELTHYRHGDHLWSLLRGICLVLHWFNPLVWWAAILSRRDCELACDEATIRRLGEGERAAYGRTLIYMTCQKRPAMLVTATTMTGSKGSIRERIALIVKKPRTAVITLVAVLLAAAVAVGCTFTGGKTPETPEPTAAAAPASPEPSAAMPTPAVSAEPTTAPKADAEAEKAAKAEAAIHDAVMDSNKNTHKAGEFACESHMQVAMESSPGEDGGTLETYYLMILYMEYDWADGELKNVSGSYIPSALRFAVSEGGEYALTEYWTPRDGTYYWDDLRGKFPADVPDEDLNDQNPKYVGPLHNACEAQARAYFLMEDETDRGILEAAIPAAAEYAMKNGRLLGSDGASILRETGGRSVEAVFPCLGKRYSICVPFRKGENGSWVPSGYESVYLAEDRERDFVELKLDLGEQKVPEPVAQYALETVQRELGYYERQLGYVFDEAKVTGITFIPTGAVGTTSGCGLYLLEYRLLPAADQEIMLVGGMTMENGWLTEWGSAGQPYLLVYWKSSNGVDSWTPICVTNTEEIMTEYGSPEMLEKYGDVFTAAAAELKAKNMAAQSLMDPRYLSVSTPASNPEQIGMDWSAAFAERLLRAPEDDPWRCETVEVRNCSLIGESLLSEPKTYVYSLELCCDLADETELNKATEQALENALVVWEQDEVQPGRMHFLSFIVLESQWDGSWKCVKSGMAGGWGYLNYSWDVSELLERMVTEQMSGEDALMLLPLIDWAEFDRLPSDAWDASFNALWKKSEEACLTGGRYWDAERTVLYSDKYFYDQIIRDMYVILGFLHADGAYAEGLASLMAKQYEYDPARFENCLTLYLSLTEEQVRDIRLSIENERPGGIPYDAQLRFYDASGNPVSDNGGWYELSMIDSIGVAWSGNAPLGVRLLTTPTGTGTYNETQILAQRSLSREETEGQEIRFFLSELKASPVMGHLWAELDYGTELHASTYYQVYREVDSVTLNRQDITLSRIGESYTLQATVIPASTRHSVIWTSDDPEVAAVDENGMVTAVDHGTTVVRASAGGVTAACTVRVTASATGQNENEQPGNDDLQSGTKKKVEYPLLNRVGIILTGRGETYTLQPVFTPQESDEPLRWTSSDPTVATVDASGTVTAVSDGKAIIRADAEMVYAECIVRVELLESEGGESVIAALHIYDGPTREMTEPKGIRRMILDGSNPDEAEAIDKIKSIIDGIRFWTDDELVDRLAFYFDGDIVFSDREFVYYFSYDKQIVFYDRYFSTISKEDMEYIKSIAGE